MGATAEIERKYLLVCRPCADEPLLADARALLIEQTYLTCADGEERVRRTVDLASGDVSFWHTRKREQGPLSRLEEERAIDADEYEALLARRDRARATLRKRRYRFPYRGRTWELDLYERPPLVLLEVELADERERPSLPPFAAGAEEVSADPRYRAHALARKLALRERQRERR
jgi:CYTH domain-containing protein